MKSYVLCVPGNLNLLFCPIMMSICIMILNPSHQFLDAVWTRYWFLETWFKPEKCNGQFLDSSNPDRNRPEMYWKGSKKRCRCASMQIPIQKWIQNFDTDMVSIFWNIWISRYAQNVRFHDDIMTVGIQLYSDTVYWHNVASLETLLKLPRNLNSDTLDYLLL